MQRRVDDVVLDGEGLGEQRVGLSCGVRRRDSGRAGSSLLDLRNDARRVHRRRRRVAATAETLMRGDTAGADATKGRRVTGAAAGLASATARASSLSSAALRLFSAAVWALI